MNEIEIIFKSIKDFFYKFNVENCINTFDDYNDNSI